MVYMKGGPERVPGYIAGSVCAVLFAYDVWGWALAIRSL